jgi:hypothetical protein
MLSLGAINTMTENKNNELANGVGAAAQKALDFIEKIIAGPLIEATGTLTDKVKFWRFKNQVDIILKAREYLKERGIETPKKVPIKDVTTLLEHASFEENEKMQDNWAKLLSNTLDPNNKFDACHIFSQILNQLSINEINILKHLFRRSFISHEDHRPYLTKKELIGNSMTDHQTSLLLMDNLLRLRLIEEQPPKLKETGGSTYLYQNSEQIPENEIVSSDCFRLSKFGTEFLRQIFR